MLIPMGRENVVVVSEIVGAVVDVIINALLIPKYGASGAAIGTVTAEFAVLAVQAIALKTTVLPLVRQIPVWKHVLAAVPPHALDSRYIFPYIHHRHQNMLLLHFWHCRSYVRIHLRCVRCACRVRRRR